MGTSKFKTTKVVIWTKQRLSKYFILVKDTLLGEEVIFKDVTVSHEGNTALYESHLVSDRSVAGDCLSTLIVSYVAEDRQTDRSRCFVHLARFANADCQQYGQ